MILTVGDINAQSTNISLGFVPPLPVNPINGQSSLSPVRLGSAFSNPVVVNRAPAPGSEEYARETIRFGVRDIDRQVLKSTIQCYIGYGSAWWGGGILPEDDERTRFILRSRVGAPSQPADRELDGDDLVLTKSLVGLQESIYEFGGLQAPANYDAPLMLEFTFSVDSYTVDSQGWTGVFAGLKGANKGVAIKLVDDGTKKIELHSADPASATPIYSYEASWVVGTFYTLKLLWYPELDLMRLYASMGDMAGADEALIHGAVSAFPDLPDDEIPSVQPVAFFGHGGFSSISVSRWSSVHLYNVVTRALVDGIPRGGHSGNFLTDASVLYDASNYPRKVVQPWNILPSSFGTIGGEEVLQADGRLTLRRTSYGESLGFYREEPKVGIGPTILDFRLWGNIADRPPGDGPESGIEVYVDDGSKKAVVEFLDSGGEQSVGLRDGPSSSSDWSVEAHYRLIVDPLAAARLLILDRNDDGVVETEFVGINYSFLPASGLPSPAIGFLHDANVVQARGELHLSWLKYSLDARMWEGVYGAPASPWNQFGTGTPTLAWDILTINDASEVDNLGFERTETQSDNKGLYMEAICKVETYSKNALIDQDRVVTGVGFTIDDDLVQYELMFAEAGPEFGKIAFLTTNEDRDQNLIDIRARKDEVRGTYFAVDWTKFHHYRIERVVGGNIAVFVDWHTSPVIEMPVSDFDPIASTSEGARFGSLLTDRKTTSQWQSVRYGISSGWDVEALPNDEELRYENAVNVLVEVDS